MAQKNVELILFRQFASYITFPIFIVDQDGNLIFCNEAVEKILGFRFSETGEISADEWNTILVPQDQNGHLIKKDKLPLSVSRTQHRIAYDQFYIKNIKNETKHVELITIPVITQSNTFLGSVAFMQEIST